MLLEIAHLLLNCTECNRLTIFICLFCLFLLNSWSPMVTAVYFPTLFISGAIYIFVSPNCVLF